MGENNTYLGGKRIAYNTTGGYADEYSPQEIGLGQDWTDSIRNILLKEQAEHKADSMVSGSCTFQMDGDTLSITHGHVVLQLGADEVTAMLNVLGASRGKSYHGYVRTGGPQFSTPGLPGR